MNARTIWVANQKTQQKYRLTSTATTLGELQDELTGQGIDFTGMSFTEGLSRSQLLDRSSLLPTTVMRNGQPTTDLVILLTNTTKNIASGAGERDRKTAYSIISEMGTEAKEIIKEKYGRNFTQVSTDNLWAFIDSCEFNPDEEDEEDEEDNEVKVLGNPDSIIEAPHANTMNWFYDGIKAMVTDNVLCAADIDALTELLQEYSARLKESSPNITEEEVDYMMKRF